MLKINWYICCSTLTLWELSVPFKSLFLAFTLLLSISLSDCCAHREQDTTQPPMPSPLHLSFPERRRQSWGDDSRSARQLTNLSRLCASPGESHNRPDWPTHAEPMFLPTQHSPRTGITHRPAGQKCQTHSLHVADLKKIKREKETQPSNWQNMLARVNSRAVPSMPKRYWQQMGILGIQAGRAGSALLCTDLAADLPRFTVI